MNMLIFFMDFVAWSDKKIKLVDLLFNSPIPAVIMLMFLGPVTLLAFGQIHTHDLQSMYLSVIEALSIAFGIGLLGLLLIFTLVKISKRK